MKGKACDRKDDLSGIAKFIRHAEPAAPEFLEKVVKEGIARQQTEPDVPKYAHGQRDALAHYDSMFAARGMRNDASGIDTQRHLFVQLREVIKKESSLRGGSLSAERTQIEAGKATLAGVHPVKREIVDVAAAQF